jgi:hypothetical protein
MGGCCLLALLLTIGPRIVLVLLWLFTNDLSRAFGGSWLLPLLGFFFLPWTTIAYTFVMLSGIGLGVMGILIVVGGLLLDLGSHGGGYRARRRTVVYE